MTADVSGNPWGHGRPRVRDIDVRTQIRERQFVHKILVHSFCAH